MIEFLQSGLSLIGVKPAASRVQARIRLLITILLISAIIWIIYDALTNVKKPKIVITQIDQIASPGTALYRTLADSDEASRLQYIHHMNAMLNNSEPTIIKKYASNIRIALIAAILSDYILHASFSKSIGSIAKTIIYQLIFITIT